MIDLTSRFIAITESRDKNGKSSHLNPVWTSFTLDDLETFERDVKAWFKDKTQYGSKAIESVDYQEMLEYFRDMSEWSSRD